MPATAPLPDAAAAGVLVITGATGWVGRTAIDTLQARIGPEALARRVRLFASRAGRITLNPPGPEPGLSLPVQPLDALSDLAETEPIAAVLQTAFLTRDRLAAIGSDTYVATNRWITDQVASALRRSPEARAVVISSGAAAPYDGSTDLRQPLAEDPYGVLKREEELSLADAATCALVLRIYALSGRHMREPNRFALGDFLLTALRGEAIRIKATMPVWRSYGHADDITGLAWDWLLSADAAPGAGTLAAVSASIDLLSLAQRITDLYGLRPVESAIDPQAQASSYVAATGPFLDALHRHGLKATGLDDQIKDTAAGLAAGLDPSFHG